MISTHLGVCPQQDIQYDQLTAMEVGGAVILADVMMIT